ncbi:fibrous sheath-interacting protein 2 [Acridotheres tristis]
MTWRKVYKGKEGKAVPKLSIFGVAIPPVPSCCPRRPHLGGDTKKMDPELLNLPLAVKIPVAPGTKPVFSRGKLGEKLHQPHPDFNLDDPYIHQLSPAYNCLHDPILRDYHNRKDILQLLKRQGFVTSDKKVVCTLKEFNEYRHYLTRIKLQLQKILGQQEEGLLPLQAKLKDGPKLPGTTDSSCRGKQRPQPQKPSSLSPPKSRKSGGCRKGRVALDKGQTYARAELGLKGATSAADSQRKPDANGLLNAVFEQLTAAEAKKLEELVETVVHRLLDRLKISGNHVSILQRAGRGIRERLLGSCLRVELSDTFLDHHQNMEVIAKELVAAVLEILEDHLASSTSKAAETGVAASWEELPLAGRATQADKSKDTETATADRVLSPTSLDTLTREVLDCSLESFLTSQFEQDTSSDYSEILELPGGNVSNRQLQPSQTLPRQGAAKDTLPSVDP